jgi:single-strand DNA-binding protein
MSKFDENDCRFIGTLGKAIEIKTTPAGLAIANFSIACGKSIKKGDSWENKTEWVGCVCFGKTAEYLANNTNKGSILRVVGEFTTSNYEKDGVKIYKTQITASAVKIISGKTEVQQDTQEDLPNGDDSGETLPF